MGYEMKISITEIIHYSVLKLFQILEWMFCVLSSRLCLHVSENLIKVFKLHLQKQ